MRWKKKKRIRMFLTCLLGILMIGMPFTAHADVGKLYTCKITPGYAHPVTGKIEDSGGSSSKATGQGMVESAVQSKGLLEVTQSGSYYLSFTMSLQDYAKNFEFSVQKKGENGWTKKTATKTGTGSDGNGSTANYCIEVPSESTIVRCSMYVEPMGRNVVFYFYPSDYATGNTSGLKATHVTQEESSTNQASSTTAKNTSTNVASENTQQPVTTESGQTASTDTEQSEGSLQEAQGLSLSTGKNVSTTSTKKNQSSILRSILILTISMTVSGCILLFVAAGIVYYFRKNWKNWGPDEEEYGEIYEENKD